MNKTDEQDAQWVTLTLEEAVERHNRGEGRTDCERLEHLTDEEIEEAVRNDPDAPPIMYPDFWEKADRIDPAKKTLIHIYVDNDIAEYLRKNPEKYHTRLNQVLREYVETQRARKQSA